MRRQPSRLVFIDETSVNTKMTRLRERARKGRRLKASAPFGKWGTQTFIAGLRHDGLRELEDENGRLKKIVADLTLDREMLQDVIRRKL